MDTLSEEHTGRAVQLRHHNTLGTVDDERTVLRHVGNGAQEHVGRHRTEIFMVGVGTVQFHLRLQRYRIGESSFKTLINGVTWRVDEIVEEFEHEVVTRVGDREIFGEHLIESVVFSQLRRCVELQEILEGLQLHVEEIRCGHRIGY